MKERDIKCCTQCPLSGGGEEWGGICYADPKHPAKIPLESYDGPPPQWCPLPITLTARVRQVKVPKP